MAEIKLDVDLNTSKFSSQLQEIRSQLGMAISGATGFGGAASALAGSPSLGGSGFGHTFTNAAMAYSPHYGAIQASTTVQQEYDVSRGGLAAAQQLKPPGVAPASYAMAAMANSIDREVTARQEAASAARATFWTGAGGLAAGEAAAVAVGAPVGAMLGAGIAKRFLGPGAGKAGAMLGGLAGSFAAFDFAQEYVGGKIEKHFAEVEQIGGFTRELGNIAGGGLGLNRRQKYDLGVAAREAAGDLKMDVQQMGDTLALGREAGLLPSSQNPGKAREQYREFAKAIEEGAQILQTSLAGATQVIKQASQQGMSATQGITQAAGAGGADVWLQQQARMNAFGSAGAAAGRSMGFSGAQGRGVYMGGFGAAGAAGMSGEEMKIVGGRFGAAAFVGQAQMSMAASPMGDMQLMAAMGGHSGGSMMEMAGAAMDGMTSGGGDFMSNIGKFMVHKNEYRRGIGKRGVQTLAREQMRMGGEMIQQFMPDMSANEAQRMYGISSMGLDADRAKLLAGGGRGGGGRGGRGRSMGASRIAKATVAMSDATLGIAKPDQAEIDAQVAAAPSGFGFGEAISGGLSGGAYGLIGGTPMSVAGGAVLGAGIGFVSQNYQAIRSIFDDGPGLNSSPQEKADYYNRKADDEYDKKVQMAKDELGYVDASEDEIKRFLTTDLSKDEIDLDASSGSSTATKMTAGRLKAAGLKTVDPGWGTMKVNNEYFSTAEVQKVARNLGTGVSKKQEEMGAAAAFKINTNADKYTGAIQLEHARGKGTVKQVYTTQVKKVQGLKTAIRELGQGERPELAGENYATIVRDLLENGDVDPETLAKIKEEGLSGGTAVSFVSNVSGVGAELIREKMSASAAAGGANAFQGKRELTLERQAKMIGGLVGDDEATGKWGNLPKHVLMERALERQGLSKDEAARTRKAFDLRSAEGGFDKGSELGQRFEELGLYGMDEKFSGRSKGSTLGSFSHDIATAVRETGLGARIRDAGDDPKKRAAVQKEYQELNQRVFNENGAENARRGILKGGQAPDLYEEIYVRGAENRTGADKVGAGFWGAVKGGWDGGVVGAIESAKKAVLDVDATTTPAAELQDDNIRRDSDVKTKKPKRRGGNPMQNAAGFGERESAMSTINKALRHSERMHKITLGQVKDLNLFMLGKKT